MANSTAKYLNGNQLIRMREIFNPFFKVLEECCTSYAIYKCTIEAEVVGGESRVKFDFKVSDERGTAKVDTILYVIEEDCFYVKDSFKFEKGSERKVNNALKKVIYDIDSIDILFNRIIVEFGSRWIMGAIVEDYDREKGIKYDGYILFLKSELVFDGYVLDKKDSAFHLD